MMDEHTKTVLRLLRDGMGDEVPTVQLWAAAEIERLHKSHERYEALRRSPQDAFKKLWAAKTWGREEFDAMVDELV